MNFNEKLIELRKSKGLSQDELGNALGVSLDALVKDIDVRDIRNKNLSEKQLSSIYEDVSSAKSTINKVVNILCIIGVVGLTLAILAGIFWG